jgi:hypothetical protein
MLRVEDTLQLLEFGVAFLCKVLYFPILRVFWPLFHKPNRFAGSILILQDWH